LQNIVTPNGAQALRDAGFTPTPRLWVKNEDMVKIYAMVNSVDLQVREIRYQARMEYEANFSPKVKPDPITDKEAAWAAYEESKP
jgi:hypothetical protein